MESNAIPPFQTTSYPGLRQTLLRVTNNAWIKAFRDIRLDLVFINIDASVVNKEIMARIVECVPNFSEGRNKEVIDAIAQAIASVDGCSLLDVDPGVSTNRTVYTFVGSPESVVEGALNGARMAMQLIDMTSHQGTVICLV